MPPAPRGMEAEVGRYVWRTSDNAFSVGSRAAMNVTHHADGGWVIDGIDADLSDLATEVEDLTTTKAQFVAGDGEIVISLVPAAAYPLMMVGASGGSRLHVIGTAQGLAWLSDSLRRFAERRITGDADRLHLDYYDGHPFGLLRRAAADRAVRLRALGGLRSIRVIEELR